MMREPRPTYPHPFLKWVGGKRQLLPSLLAEIEALGAFGRYHEPFVGGGAVFFELSARKMLGRKKALLSDTNPNLIVAYEGVRDCVEDVILLLEEHAHLHGHDHYYGVRHAAPEGLAERAARVIYLNRTCYNGLYRENSRGQFNVPMGRYVNPQICNADNLRAVSRALAHAQIETRPFDTVLGKAEKGDLVYFDPPYVPLSPTSNFTDYAKGGFGEAEQRRLAGVFATLARRGVRVLLSNSAAPLVRELYEGFTIHEVLASRNVNSKGDRRGKIAEALVTSRKGR